MKTLTFVILFFCMTANAICQEKTSVEIPIDEQSNPVFLYKVAKNYSKLLNLPSLETGYDSLQIRIWCAYGNLKKTHLIVISNKQGVWDGTLYRLLIDVKNDTSYFLEKEEKLNPIPKSGWRKIITTMNKLAIPALKSYEYFPGYGVGADGYFYMVEVATKNSYRFYNYLDPQDQEKRFKEAAALEKFLKFMEKEFSFNRMEIFE